MPGLERVRRERHPRVGDGLAQRRDRLGRDPVGIATEAVTLDHEPEVEDFLEIVVTHRADVGPAARLQRQQALGFQNPDRLANRGATEPEVPRELRLVQPLAGRELARDDRLSQMPGGLGRQRRGFLKPLLHRFSGSLGSWWRGAG